MVHPDYDYDIFFEEDKCIQLLERHLFEDTNKHFQYLSRFLDK